jgi:hypothetical protein
LYINVSTKSVQQHIRYLENVTYDFMSVKLGFYYGLIWFKIECAEQLLVAVSHMDFK